MIDAAANRSALLRRCPWLAEALRASAVAASLLARQDGGPDLMLNGARLYGGDGESLSRVQAEAWLRQPQTLNVPPPQVFEETDTVVNRARRRIQRAAGWADGQGPSGPPGPPAGWLLSFGLGLGFHLPLLDQAWQPKRLVVFEVWSECLQAALQSWDWAGWLAQLEARGGRFDLLLIRQPADLIAGMGDLLRSADHVLLDGTGLFRHYPHPVLDDAARQFVHGYNSAMPALGWTEDEWIMLRNTGTNLGRARAAGRDRVLRPAVRTSPGLPACIVGSGPSLDGALEPLRRNRDGLVLISCGTGLRSLVKAGIKPDLHCEIENLPATYDVAEELASQHDIADLPLVASTTVDSRLPLLFGETIWMFRIGLGATRILGEEGAVLGHTFPTVTNMGASVAAALGFDKLILMGVDLGARDAARHHASDAIYFQGEKWDRIYRVLDLPFNIPCPGNFGGTINSTSLFAKSRDSLADLFASVRQVRPRFEVLNASDGVAIGGTRPALAAGLRLAPDVRRRQAWLEDLLAGLPRLEPKGLEGRLAALESLVARSCDMAAAAAAGEATPLGLLAELDRWLPVERCPVEMTVLVGSLYAVVECALGAWRRLPGDRRRPFEAAARQAFAAAVAEIRAGTGEVLMDIRRELL